MNVYSKSIVISNIISNTSYQMKNEIIIDFDSIIHILNYLQQSFIHSILFRFALDQQE